MIPAIQTAVVGRLLAAFGLGASLVLGGVAASGQPNVVTQAANDLSANVATWITEASPPQDLVVLPSLKTEAQSGGVREATPISAPAIDIRMMLASVDQTSADVTASGAQTTSPVAITVGGMEAHPVSDRPVDR